MRDDQYTKLKALSEKLTDVVLTEADPALWNGNDQELAKLTREERGDRYWCKKNAAATLSVLMRVHNLVGVIERDNRPDNIPPSPDAGGPTDLEKEVAAAERTANAILERVAKASRARSN